MHGDQVFSFIHLSTSYSSQFFHMTASATQQSNMLAHCSYIGPCFTRDPKYGEILFFIEVQQFALINGPYS